MGSTDLAAPVNTSLPRLASVDTVEQTMSERRHDLRCGATIPPHAGRPAPHAGRPALPVACPGGNHTLLATLVAHADLVEYPSKHPIYSAGEPGDLFYLVVTGKVKLGVRASDGRERIVSLVGPREMFGEASILDDAPRATSATAITDVQLLSLDRHTLGGEMARRPEVADWLLQMLARRVRRRCDDYADALSSGVASRLAKLLLCLGQRFGTYENGVLQVAHDLTQMEIAQFVGASREAINRTLAEFASRGWPDFRSWWARESRNLWFDQRERGISGFGSCYYTTGCW